MPEAVLFSITSRARLQASVAGWQRGQERNAIRRRGVALLAEGWKPVAVAHELKVTVHTVERWRRSMP